MKYLKMFINRITKLFSKKEVHVECKTDEYCPIYLSYVNKYGEKSPEVKLCKNPNKQYCTKYRLVDKTEWQTLSKEERLNIITEMHLLDFDYVLIKQNYLKILPYGKIKEKEDFSVVPYLVGLINSTDFWVRKDMIVRKLNQHEIDFFDLEIASNKYNL